jgi:hypothetical protein
MKKPVLSIDGARFDDLQGFAREISARVLAGQRPRPPRRLPKPGGAERGPEDPES